MSVADLIAAIEAGNFEKVVEIARPEIINKSHRFTYPLWVAASLEPENVAIMRHLLSFPATDPNIGGDDSEGLYTPLGQAIYAGNAGIVDVLLNDDRVFLNRGGGCYPLHVAVQVMNDELFFMMLRHDRGLTSDINVQYMGKNVLEFAVEDWDANKVELEEHVDNLLAIFERCLSDHTFGFNYDSIMPFVFYVPNLPLQLAEIVFSNIVRADVRHNHIDHKGENMLHHAINSPYAGTVRFILDSGLVDQNQINADGNTPFLKYCLSLEKYNYEQNIHTFLIFLSNRNVNVRLTSGDGRRPMEILLNAIHKLNESQLLTNVDTIVLAAATMLIDDRIIKADADIKFICDNRKTPFVDAMLRKAERRDEDFVNKLKKQCRRAEKAATKNKKGGARRRKTQRKNRNTK
jgi:hypothetical protein